MTVSAAPLAIKRKIRDLMVSALPDFDVTWGFTTGKPPAKWAYMGQTQWESADWATNRQRELTLHVPIVVNAIMRRTSPEDAEAYVLEQLDALEDAFNADSSLRGVGVVSWGLVPGMSGAQPYADGGVEAQAAASLSVKYRR